MKSCPACNRTFEDTFTFCLVDGSILSAPFDPQATLVLPNKRNIDLSPTEASPLEASPNNLQPTIPSPQINMHPPNLAASPEKEHHTDANNANGADKNVYIASAILILIAIIVAVIIQQNY